MSEKTTVHLLRHGEVHNPEGVLYGRMDGYHLSDLGQQMAQVVADAIKHRDITHLRVSPLERAQETARPLAVARDLAITTDDRVIESGNLFQGKRFAGDENALKDPRTWRHLWNPFRPSWGEPFKEVAARMMAAVEDTRDEARGHEAVIVSHQLPIWVTRLHVEKRSFLHDRAVGQPVRLQHRHQHRRDLAAERIEVCFARNILDLDRQPRLAGQ
ncbi:MAG TPA: histidine phosphatase family protein, partial [Nocardioides sp.]